MDSIKGLGEPKSIVGSDLTISQKFKGNFFYLDKKMMYCKRPIYNLMLLLLLSGIFAKLEINIEGDQGWAKGLPTWKKKMGSFELTGYHLFMWVFLILIFHLPFLFTEWNMEKEYFALSFLFAFLLTEDALWFFLHHDFKGKEDTWRNPKICGSVPYFFFIAGGISLLTAWKAGCTLWAKMITMLLFCILISYPLQVS